MRIELHIERIIFDGPLPNGGTDPFRAAFVADLARGLHELPRAGLQPQGVEACVADSISRVIAPGGAR